MTRRQYLPRDRRHLVRRPARRECSGISPEINAANLQPVTSRCTVAGREVSGKKHLRKRTDQ